VAEESQSERSVGAVESSEPVEATDSDASESQKTAISSGPRWKRRVTIVSLLVVVLAAGLVLPPLINISRYQRQITALMTRSMGRPVRMSAVELRLLPSPGFVLHDLAVSEDPAFGAEPILSARTVVASVRLFSLWRGKLEISQVSVDEASLNLVRSPEGRWNLESLLMSAKPISGGAGQNSGGSGPGIAKISTRFPYLQATNSWVHLKNGVEKTPFALASTDLSFWQDNPGQWRVRLLGQPVRTDMPMSLADTGEVRMEASFQGTAQLREMPMKLQMEWRDAQLGQLSRLILGSDAGWRGDLRADIEVQGTPEAAVTKARLRATGVRREEFVPETSLDFDANCTFRYEHSQSAFHDIGCDTAIGDGRLHLKAEVPGQTPGQQPEAMLEVHQVPVQAALDLLRTVRSGFAPGISVKGTANGSLHYKQPAPNQSEPVPTSQGQSSKAATARLRKTASKQPGTSSSLQGSLKITGAELSGGALKASLKLPEVSLTPALVRQVAAGSGNAAPVAIQNRTKLVGLFTVPLVSAAGSDQSTSPQSPIAAVAQTASVQLFLDQHGYQAQLTGTATIDRLRELAHGFGWLSSPTADGFHGGTADFSFASQGAWIADANGDLSLQEGNVASSTGQPANAAVDLSAPATELTLHHTEWQANYLAHPVKFVQATVQQAGTAFQFAGDFTYGPAGLAGPSGSQRDASKDSGKDVGKDILRGNIAVAVDSSCTASETGASQQEQGSDAANDAASACLPKIQLHFGALDAAAVEAALQPDPVAKSVFAPITDRIHSSDSSDRPKMPAVSASMQADSLVLGPVTLQKPVMQLRSLGNEIKIVDWGAQLLGGSAKGSGHIGWDSGKPEYDLLVTFTQFSGSAVGALLDSRWTGGTMDGGGKVTLSGLTPKDLGSSALGDVRFDWRHGSMIAASAPPVGELHFERWVGVGTIAVGKIRIDDNTVVAGRGRYSVEGTIPFGGPVKLTLNPNENSGPNPRLMPIEGGAKAKDAPSKAQK
jgi:AsmA family